MRGWAKPAWPDPRAAGIVHISERPLLLCEPHDRTNLLDRHQVIGHGEPGQSDKRDRFLSGDRLLEHCEPSSVDKAGADMVRGTHHRGMAVARRCADHYIARPHQCQVRGERGTRQAVEHRDIVPVWRPAEMRQCQRPQRLEIERRYDLVVGEA